MTDAEFRQTCAALFGGSHVVSTHHVHGAKGIRRRIVAVPVASAGRVYVASGESNAAAVESLRSQLPSPSPAT